jgi:putative heme-binding domain-containing protein
MQSTRPLSGLLYVTLAGLGVAAEGPQAPLSDAEILRRVSFPAQEFDATVFASPPKIDYPIFVSAAADGTLLVGCDQNGSLDRRPNRGRVVMCRDTDGDGKADTFSTFATMDSPRGVAWDAATRTLYVMHPPNLTAYHDDNGTGVANRQEDLITGLGFGLDFRGADHTTNGIRMGIDGWIYIAVGDYGAVKAIGRDGASLAMRGGGIVRVRPDGTGMERVVWGTRNILSVAVSPTLELFTRDNTNDGDDWNDRLSFDPFGANMGYPTLFRNFADETIPALIDYGGGSPVGSVFIDEPALPQAWARGFFSVEWGRGEVDLHPLTPAGATYTADTRQLVKMVRPTDMDVDAAGRLYLASWDGAHFRYTTPYVGYIVRLTPKGAKPAAPPVAAKLDEKALVAQIGSPSAVLRFAAQRELLVRGAKPGVAEGLLALVGSSRNLGVRVAAMCTLQLLLGAKSVPLLVPLARKDELHEYVLKVLAQDRSLAAAVPAQPFLDGLADADPRVRLQAVTGLWHLGKTEAIPELLTATADADYTVAHVAMRGLEFLKADAACLSALDSADAKVQPGALRALQTMYDPKVVDGLIKRLATAKPELRLGIFKVLCRLAYKEAVYSDPKMWWATRPDTSGPIYKPEPWEESEKIQGALKQAFDATEGDEAKACVVALMRHKVAFPGLTAAMLAKSGTDTASRLDVIQSLVSTKTPGSAELLEALFGIATVPAETPERARALRLLSSSMGNQDVPGLVIEAFAALAEPAPGGGLATVWEEFTRDQRLAKRSKQFASLAQDSDARKRLLGATVLVDIATSTVQKEKGVKEAALKEIAQLWGRPAAAAALLTAIGRTRASEFTAKVNESAGSADPTVAAAAKLAAALLGGAQTGAPARTIGQMTYEDVVEAVLAVKPSPQPETGRTFFLQQGCIICHTLSAKEPPKGPMLGGINARYTLAELCESVLRPSAKIAQGFESQRFTMRDKAVIEGFVTREGGDSVDVCNIAGIVTTLEKGDIAKRERIEKSIMPEGLVNNITPEDLAALLAFLGSQK